MSHTHEGSGYHQHPECQNAEIEPQPSTSSLQGFGREFALDGDFISKMALLVSAQISKQKEEEQKRKFRPVVSDDNQFYQKSEPASACVTSDNTAPPVPFNNQVFQNDMNDGYDEKRLLKKVPKRFQLNAQNLLNAFNQRPNELTWDLSGNRLHCNI